METQVYLRHGEHRLTADIFRPHASTGPLPCLGFFHGGGWANGSPTEFHAICAWFAAHGYVAISFAYRLCPQPRPEVHDRPAITPVECSRDARAALRWVLAEAESLGIDRNRIVFGGQSAGGQLALATVLADAIDPAGPIRPMPRGFLLYSSNHNTLEGWADALCGERGDELRGISPFHTLIAGMPPVCSFHGGKDSMVPPYIVDFFKRRTETLGNRYVLHRFPERGHYLGAPDRTYATLVDEDILERSVVFLADIL